MDIWGKLTAFLSNQAPAMLTKLVVAALILVLARVIGGTLATTVGRMLEKHRDGALKQILSKLVKTVVMIIGVLTALDHLGIDIKTLLAGAGILGLAIGFGAQSLVKDVISGFFILFDDVLRVGDFAKVGEASGVVEDVGLRLTCVRSFNGQLWYINNGNISNVGNFNRQWSRAIAEVGVAYEQDVGLGLQILQQVGDAYAKDCPDMCLDPPLAQGVTGLNASDVGLRLVVKTKAGQCFAVERELRLRIKAAFDAASVEIPFARHVIYHRREEGQSVELDKPAG